MSPIRIDRRERRYGPVVAWVIGLAIAALCFLVGYLATAFVGGLVG